MEAMLLDEWAEIPSLLGTQLSEQLASLYLNKGFNYSAKDYLEM